MIYLNNAGTTWPKPDEVALAMNDFTELSPERWSELYEQCLHTVANFFNLPKERLLFTTSCTAALSIAFSDFPWEQGDRLIISHMEHHALSRWFHKLQREQGVEGVVIPRASDGPIDMQVLEQELQKGARMVAVSMATNVTGELLPYAEIVKLAHQYGALCLLDGAQTSGIVPIDISSLQPDLFVFAGHKGPLGPQGIGGLYITESVSMICPSAACEITPGSGKPAIFPTYCDAGSVNMIALAGMSAGIAWLNKQGWSDWIAKRKKFSSALRRGLAAIPGVIIYGKNDADASTGAVAVNVDGMGAGQLGDLLWNDYQIKTGSGFQCAPMAHEAIGTAELGTVRLSVGHWTKDSEIEAVLHAFSEIALKLT
ncbi:MAG: aminotransferase class V-fold PLP-dependent enzyme [Bacteroidota bacterium]